MQRCDVTARTRKLRQGRASPGTVVVRPSNLSKSHVFDMAEAAASDTGSEGVGAAGFDSSTRDSVQRIPLLSVRAGPRDQEWRDRLKEEYQALIQVRRCASAALRVRNC